MHWEQLKGLIENPKHTKKKITLNDGRHLSYSECGNVVDGLPVLFCFGLMTSSVAVMFAHYAAINHNLRIIAVDYPGIGESSIQEDRTLSGWADDMMQFCDQVLGPATKVRLLGHSLGGLHVLALLSDRTFKARVKRIVLLSPWLYIEGREYNPTMVHLARNLPQFVQSQIIPTILTQLSSGSIQVAGWSNPHHTQIQAAKIVTNYGRLQGQHGNEQMVRFALSKSDLFLPQDLEAPIHIFHGKKDVLVLDTAIFELVDLLRERRCKVNFTAVEDGDHNSVMAEANNLQAVMESLVGKSEPYRLCRSNQKSRDQRNNVRPTSLSK